MLRAVHSIGQTVAGQSAISFISFHPPCGKMSAGLLSPANPAPSVGLGLSLLAKHRFQQLAIVEIDGARRRRDGSSRGSKRWRRSCGQHERARQSHHRARPKSMYP
jgi:hypothetical protein